MATTTLSMAPRQSPSQGATSVLPISPAPGTTASTTTTNGTAPTAADTPSAMTEDEIALYDRQIRLWGMRAQEQIRSAHVLLITMRALGNEVAKNLVLAGVGALTIADPAPVAASDLGAQFLLAGNGQPVGPDASKDERDAAAAAAAAAVVGQNRAAAAVAALRLMNPRVRLTADATEAAQQAAAYFQPFDLVVATDLDAAALAAVNAATRRAGRPLYGAATYGFFGFVFADLLEHDFVLVRQRGNVVPTVGAAETPTRTIVDVQAQPPDREAVTKRERYAPWPRAAATDGARLPAAIRQSPRRLRNVSPTLPCLRALWAYQLEGTTETAAKDPLRPPMATFTALVVRAQTALGSPPVPAAHIRLFLQGLDAEISPVATALGGQLAQDIINTLGHSQQPIQNLLVFDGASAQAPVYALQPDGPLGREATEGA